MARLVCLEVDEEAERLFPRRLVAAVRFEYVDGSVRTARAEAPGSPAVPLPAAAVNDKLVRLAGPVLDAAATADLLRSTRALPDDAAVARIGALLTGSATALAAGPVTTVEV